MFRSAKWIGVAALAGVTLLAGAPAARSQVIIRGIGPGTDLGNLIRAQGQFMIDNQKAQLMQQEVRAKKMENRRAQLEQWMWERDNLPTANDERERAQRAALRRSRNDPPVTEIWSAKALNDLLADCKKSFFISEGQAVINAPLPPELLAKINVSNGRGDGNLGLIKSGKLAWPMLLRRSIFNIERERMDQLIVVMVMRAGEGNLDPDLLDEAFQRAEELNNKLVRLSKSRNELGYFNPTQYLDARRFLEQLEHALKGLLEPNAGDYLTGKYAAKGPTVKDLVEHMKNNGLQFAAATPGGYEAYAALYQALRDFNVSISPPDANK
jgi:hypothetical protein